MPPIACHCRDRMEEAEGISEGGRGRRGKQWFQRVDEDSHWRVRQELSKVTFNFGKTTLKEEMEMSLPLWRKTCSVPDQTHSHASLSPGRLSLLCTCSRNQLQTTDFSPSGVRLEAKACVFILMKCWLWPTRGEASCLRCGSDEALEVSVSRELKVIFHVPWKV